MDSPRLFVLEVLEDIGSLLLLVSTTFQTLRQL